MSERTPTIGRIVHYTLTAEDANRVRSARLARADAGLRVQGYSPSPGQVLPMIITAVGGDFVNGQVFLDSDDILWVSTVRESDSLYGCWYWPEIIR